MGCTQSKSQVRDYSSYLNFFNKRSGQGKYFLKALTHNDLKNDYFALIKQEKSLEFCKIDDSKLKQQISDMLIDSSYYILVWVCPSIKIYIVASATLNFQKSIGNNFAKSAHISNVVVDENHRNKGLGKSLKEALTLIAFKEENVNKLIDDTEMTEDKKNFKIITKEEFDVQYSDFNITSDPKEIRFLDHKAQVVALTSYLKYDETSNGDKEFLISCSLDPNIKIWDLQRNECLQTIESTHEKNITTILCVKRGEDIQLLTASMDQTIQLIDLEEGSLVSKYMGHTNSVTCLLSPEGVFHPEGFLSGSDDGTIKFWKFESSDAVSELKVDVPIKSMSSFPDYDENIKFSIGIGLSNGKILIIDGLTQKLLTSMVHSENKNEKMSSITCLDNFKLKDTRLLLSGCLDGSIKVWNAHNGNLIKVYDENKLAISCLSVAVLKGSYIFITGSMNDANGEIKLWNFEEDKSFKTFNNFGFSIKSIQYLDKYEWLSVSWNNGFRVLKLN